MVRAGSARHRNALVPSGHERSRSASQNHRSHALHRYDLGRQRKLSLGSNPTSPPTQAPERPDRSGGAAKGVGTRRRRDHSRRGASSIGVFSQRGHDPPRDGPGCACSRPAQCLRVAGRLWPAGACGGSRADARRAPGWAAAGGTGGGLGARLEPRPRPRSRPGRRGGRPGGGVHGGGAGAGPRGRRRAVRHQCRPRPLGAGVGRTLLAAAQAELTRLGYTEAVLWVLPNNARACRFYEVAGWITDGIQRTSEVLGVAVPEVRYRRRLQTYPARLDRHSSLVTPSLPVGSLEPATRSPSTNPHPNPVSCVVAARGRRKSRLPHRSCHSRAISEGQSRYRADLASHLTKPQR